MTDWVDVESQGVNAQPDDFFFGVAVGFSLVALGVSDVVSLSGTLFVPVSAHALVSVSSAILVAVSAPVSEMETESVSTGVSVTISIVR